MSAVQQALIAAGGGGTTAVAVAVTNNGTDLISYDGLTWSTSAHGLGSNWNAIVYASGKFVCVGNSGGRTSTNGISWTSTIATGAMVCYANSKYMVLVDSNYYRHSTDGLTWSSLLAYPEPASWSSVAVSYSVSRAVYGLNDRFVLHVRGTFYGYDEELEESTFEQQKDTFYYSTDATSWTQSATTFTTFVEWTGLAKTAAFGSSRMTISGRDFSYTSTDNAANWTSQGAPSVVNNNSICFSSIPASFIVIYGTIVEARYSVSATGTAGGYTYWGLYNGLSPARRIGTRIFLFITGSTLVYANIATAGNSPTFGTTSPAGYSSLTVSDAASSLT